MQHRLVALFERHVRTEAFLLVQLFLDDLELSLQVEHFVSREFGACVMGGEGAEDGDEFLVGWLEIGRQMAKDCFELCKRGIADIEPCFQQRKQVRIVASGLFATPDALAVRLELVTDADEIFTAEESRFFQVIQQPLYGTDGRVQCGCFRVLTNGEEGERYQLKAVVEHGIHSVLLVALVGPYVVEGVHLRDQVVEDDHDILAFDISGFIGLEELQPGADLNELFEDGPLAGI